MCLCLCFERNKYHLSDKASPNPKSKSKPCTNYKDTWLVPQDISRKVLNGKVQRRSITFSFEAAKKEKKRKALKERILAEWLVGGPFSPSGLPAFFYENTIQLLA